MNHTEETVFAEALEKREPQERAAFLDRVCADAPELRASVEALLSAYEEGQFGRRHQCLPRGTAKASGLLCRP